MAWMQPCSADLLFKVCGFERWVVLQGRFKAAESKSDSALHGSRSANRNKREQNSRFAGHNGLGVFNDEALKTWPFGQSDNTVGCVALFNAPLPTEQQWKRCVGKLDAPYILESFLSAKIENMFSKCWP